MPELPEVETVRRGLAPALIGRRIERVRRSEFALRFPSPRPLRELEGQRVDSLRRHGKFLLATLDSGGTWQLHLGMSGQLTLCDADAAVAPHTHFFADLQGGPQLRYTDHRRFGSLRLYAPGETPEDLHRYGRDALDPTFDDAYLASVLRGCRSPLKAALLDQRRIAGLGNIYVCEALYRAGLSPRRRAANAPRASIPRLRAAIVDILNEAVAAGGTSFSDYVDAEGERGDYQNRVAVFQREGQPCRRCQREIRRIVQSGRATYYCPGCQR